MAFKLDPEILHQLLLMFKSELNEQIQAITEGLLLLEKGIKDKQREDCIDNIFRSAHNIKGAARGIDIKDIGNIAHSLETLFSKLRDENFVVNASLINLCLLSLDKMQSAMVSFEKKAPLDFDLQELTEQLDNWSHEENKIDHVNTTINEKINLPNEQPVTHEQLPDETQEEAPAIITPITEEDGIVRISLQKLDQISAITEDLTISKMEMMQHLNEIKQLYEDSQSFSREWVQSLAALKQTEDTSILAHQESSPLTATTSAINRFRISTQKLYKQMRESTNRFSLLFMQLQDQMRSMHLVPATTQLQPLGRNVRDIAQELGKQIDFKISGGEIELDRPILEGIKAPLIHLLRNAIDHGIETPQERIISDKPEIAQLTIEVVKANDRILITVSDDGRGINVNTIADQAIKKNLLAQHEITALSETEILDLIFRPGFSSKEIITDISGRGVGLDVVLSNVRNLKGTVKIETQLGKGTHFIINLPLTLSTDHGLMIRIGDDNFAIPISSVEHVTEIKRDEIINIGGSQAILLNDEAIPLRNLATVLELKKNEFKSLDHLFIVVISKGQQRVALLVNEIIGEQELVIKRLKKPLKSIRNVMGAAFVGSDEVIIVLNTNDLVISALRLGNITPVQVNDESTETKPSHILIVDDSITIRTFQKTTLEACGYHVHVAVDGQNAWNMIQKQDFNLIVTDVEMPFMNGFELTERIKKTDKFKHIPIIIVTSLNSEAEQRRGIEVGADAYIVKSQFESKVLLDVINQLI